MAIKKLSYDKGEELEIRTKGTRIAPNEILDNMKQYLVRPDILIVHCGKSYYDVTNHPEIYKEGSDFRPESLTSIDIKQMEKPVAPRPAYQQGAAAENPLTMLYHKTDAEDTKVEKEKLVRVSYYLRPTDVEALSIISYLSHVRLSAMVREIFERGIASIAEEKNFGDIYAAAEANLAERGFVGKKNAFEK